MNNKIVELERCTPLQDRNCTKSTIIKKPPESNNDKLVGNINVQKEGKSNHNTSNMTDSLQNNDKNKENISVDEGQDPLIRQSLEKILNKEDTILEHLYKDNLEKNSETKC